MTVFTKLLAGKNINTDSDFSKYIETVSEAGVISGLEVSTNSVAIGKCWVACERTNGETIFSLVINNSDKTIDTSGTGYVIVEIPQNYIDDGSLINEDGTGVAEIKVVSSLPTKNYLELAELNSGVITDKRNIIRKVSEINGILNDIEDLDERVEALELTSAINHLEEKVFVGERYNSASQSMFSQKTPTLSNSTLEDCHIGDITANTEIHIQRMSNGIESNKLKLKVKSFGSPTTTLKVEVRRGVQVNVSSTEAYWYGDENEILSTGSLSYTEITSNFAEKEFTLDNPINVAKGSLLDIVVFQESSGTKIVNSSNYYILACDSTQWSEAFSFVSVNGETRSRSKLMPYCISDSFLGILLCKSDDSIISGTEKQLYNSTNKDPGLITCVTAPFDGDFRWVMSEFGIYSSDSYYQISAGSQSSGNKNTTSSGTFTDVNFGTDIKRYYTSNLSRVTLSIYGTSKIHKRVDKKVIVYDIEDIGIEITGYLLGRLPDGTWWDGN